MGLFDLFKKSENNNDVIGTIEDGLKIAQVVSEAYVDLKSLKEVEKISFKDIKSLNDAFNQLVPSLTAIYEEANKEGTGLYKLTNSLKEKNVFSVNEKELASTALKLSSGKSVACIHPAVLVVAVTVVAIEKEVEIIHDECDRILTFLKNDKESQIEGDITTLNDTIDAYKYNWNIKEFCQNHHKLVLDIKRSAEQNIGVECEN